MDNIYHNRLKSIINSNQTRALKGSLYGLEKESLRVSNDGKISQTSHPAILGAALTHPFITTDYSEALLELITPPCTSIESALTQLEQTQAFVQQNLDDEILWANSMPCIVSGDASIPIADYGSSNLGVMKTVYRRGLGHRYGRMMQVIAGVHFNYSLPEAFWPVYQHIENDNQPLQDFISQRYFDMIRNLQRFGWLIPYLFGASPTVCKSFIDGVAAGLEAFDDFTFYQPFATSLRVGDIGYQNSIEDHAGIHVSYDSLDDYVRSLSYSIDTPYAEYEKIGVKIGDEYQQLNANLLQIENEYYNTVRPKQLAGREEKPSLALKNRGVRYVELRSLDLNLYEPCGVNLSQLYFLEGLMVFCLLKESPIISKAERPQIDDNQSQVAHRGRTPELLLNKNGDNTPLKQWAHELFDEMEAAFSLLDSAHNCSHYMESYRSYRAYIDDSELSPSARIISEMRDRHESFFPFSMHYSQQHADYFSGYRLDQQQIQAFRLATEQSILEQQQIEQNSQISFDQFLANYLSQH